MLIKVNRRKFLAACAAAPLLRGLDAVNARDLESDSARTQSFSQRNVLNLGFFFDNNYLFIDHIKQGDNLVGPYGAGFSTGPAFTSIIDANGWPNNASASGQLFGGGIHIPNDASFAGPYTIDFTGNGSFQIVNNSGGSS